MNYKKIISKIAPLDAIKNVSFLTAGKFCFYITGFLYGIFAARLLGAAGYGRLIVVMATVYLFSMPFDFAFASPIVKLIGERLHGKEKLRVRFLAKTALIIQIVGAFFFCVIFLVFLLLFSEDYVLLRNWTTALGLFGLSEALHKPRKFLPNILLGFQFYRAYTVTSIFVNVTRDVLPVLFMFNYGIVGACFGYLVAEIINLFYFVFLFSYLWGKQILISLWGFPLDFLVAAKKLFSNSRSNYLASLCKRGFKQLLNLILGGLIGTAGVGFYNVGLKFKPLFSFMIAPVSQYLYPRLVEKWSRVDKREFFYTLRKYFYLLGAAGVLLVVLLSAVAPRLVPLFYSEEYLPSVPVVWILLPAIFMTQLFSVFENIAFTVSEQRSILNVAVIELIVGIPIAIFLINYFGYLGAAWAFSAKTYIIVMYKAVFFYQKFGWRWLCPI